jgi:hypothetical protein
MKAIIISEVHYLNDYYMKLVKLAQIPGSDKNIRRSLIKDKKKSVQDYLGQKIGFKSNAEWGTERSNHSQLAMGEIIKQAYQKPIPNS